METTTNLTAKRTDIWNIPPSLIVIVNKNVRENYPEEDYQRLKNNIHENGIKEPIHVRKLKDGTYALSHGFNRMRAVWELIEEGCEIQYVKATSAILNEEEELLEHITLNSGVPLTKYEVSKVLIKLKAYGWNNKKLSEKTGYSEVEVSKLLNFQQNASTEVKESVAKGEIDINPAMALVKESDSITKQNETLRVGREKASLNGKIKIKGNEVLSKKLSPMEKYGKILEIIEKTSFDSENDDRFVAIEEFFYLISDGKSTPEEILNKFLVKETV